MHVPGYGNLLAKIAIVGEGPGYWESQKGQPFVGPTGEELDRLLEINNLPPREQLFLTNIFREYKGKDYVWTQADVARDEPQLVTELRMVCPTTIVCLGRCATRYFLDDVDLDTVWGVPWKINLKQLLQQKSSSSESIEDLSDDVVIFPIHHPASALYNPKMSSYVVTGFQQLSHFLAGKLQPRILFDDPIKEPHYEEITTTSTLSQVLSSGSFRSMQGTIAIDTEGYPHRPFSLQFSSEPGKAYLIRASNQLLLRRFGEMLHRIRPRLVFHSALHDLGMLRVLGINTDTLVFDDTMIMAYLLQIEPQGLKAGCLRHCNMQMQSYDDIMGDVSSELARDYLTWLFDGEQADYEARCQAEFDARRAQGRRIKKIPNLPKTPLHKAVTRVLQSKRPRGLWEDQLEDIQVSGYQALGPLPEPTLDYVDPDRAINYGCRDADGTIRLLPEYGQRLDDLGLRGVYELELSTYPLIDRMQHIGLKPDLDHFAELSTALAEEIATLASELSRSTGQSDFNANSGDQVAEYLFGTLGLPEIKFTSTGRGSTNDKILEALEHENPEYPQISTIRAYRETYKLKHTFVDRLPDFVHRWPDDGRVHATFRTTRVVTGRLASSDPNVLAQPEHGKFATDFKRGWVAEPGHVLCQWDESTVELRGLAHLSQDPVLLAIFKGERRNPDGSLIDPHAATAQRILGGQITDYMHKCAGRLAAKEVNFGIVNGMTGHGLSVSLRKNGMYTSIEDAQRWIDETLDLYKGVRAFMTACIQEARQHGFVRCLSGRIRYIGGINSYDERIREAAERDSFSTKIQESATTIMKQAEALVWQDVLPYFWKQGKWVEPLLQIHDCLKLEAECGIERELHTLMTEVMTNVPKGFSVPLAVEGEFGANFADMEKF